MCGIFGYAVRGRHAAERHLLDRCRDTLSRRGPDSFGGFEDRGLYFGFRRLAILDLSPDGAQPMSTADGRYTIVFNGEIYNYLELRAGLEKTEPGFRGHSDTEVLLRMFAREGIACLKKTNGMFAFAIYDRQERTVTLVRDRLGVKPLFYWRGADGFAFASEVRAMRRLPGFPTSIDQTALGLYLRLGVVPEWASIYPGVKKLPPGCWTRYHVDSGVVDEPTRYWDLPPVEEGAGRSEDDWIDEIEALLWDATRIRLRSDVPLGVFLSGGIDSALVAAAFARQNANGASLTIGFAGDPKDETPGALLAARALGLRALTRSVDLQEGIRALPQTMAHFDEPFADTSALPTSLVCAEARKEFIVVLSGDGGDEAFGGYDNHVRAQRWRHMDRVPASLRRSLAPVLAGCFPADSRPRRFLQRARYPVGRFGLGAKLYPGQDWADSCLRPEFNIKPAEIVRHYNAQVAACDNATSIDASQRLDLRSYMLEDILVKVDRMSMLHSLEVRSPFLDYRLIELGLRVPSELRVKGGQNKYLLRRLAQRHLPRETTQAPKRGFGIPVGSFLNGTSKAAGVAEDLQEDFSSYPNPLRKGGAAELLRMAKTNPALQSAPIFLLAYRWWCRGQMAG